MFFVEDNSLVAKRSNGKVIRKKGTHPSLFDETQSVRNDYFQYMIGNSDWSAVQQHNSNTLFVGNKYIPLSYDFDMSGFVNAPYAKDNAPTLGTGDVRERVYRVFCKSAEAMESVRQEYLAKEQQVHEIIDSEAANMPEYEVNDMHDYVEAFYAIIRNDAMFTTSIVQGCRR
jgi:hypothetical protein